MRDTKEEEIKYPEEPGDYEVEDTQTDPQEVGETVEGMFCPETAQIGDPVRELEDTFCLDTAQDRDSVTFLVQLKVF